MITRTYGFPLREDVAFTKANGQPNSGIRKTAEKFLTTLQHPLQLILEPEETVFVVTKAMAPIGILQQFTMGWALMNAFTVVLVVTDRRLLEFTMTSSGEWRGSVRVIRWADLKKAKAGGVLSGYLALWPSAGNKVQYGRVPLRAAKTLKMLLPLLTEHNTGQVSADGNFVSLCPRCKQRLTSGVFTCQHCGLEFRSPSKLRLRTLLPGGAYFYVNLKPMGLLISFVEVIFYIEALAILMSQEPNRVGAAGFFLFVIAIEKLVMYHHASHFIQLFMPVSMQSVREPIANAAAN
jgi:hypothetical protein